MRASTINNLLLLVCIEGTALDRIFHARDICMRPATIWKLGIIRWSSWMNFVSKLTVRVWNPLWRDILCAPQLYHSLASTWLVFCYGPHVAFACLWQIIFVDRKGKKLINFAREKILIRFVLLILLRLFHQMLEQSWWYSSDYCQFFLMYIQGLPMHLWSVSSLFLYIYIQCLAFIFRGNETLPSPNQQPMAVTIFTNDNPLAP